MAVKFEENLRTIAENLLNVEVNTILSPSITGEKMPPPEHAVVDMAFTYDEQLLKMGIPRDSTKGDPPSPKGSPAEFGRLGARAASAAAPLEQQLTNGAKLSEEQGEHLNTLWRVNRYANQLMGMLHDYETRSGTHIPDDLDHSRAHGFHLELLPDELVVLRKIWDIGLDRIVLQTVIQLDGDVISRIHTDLAEPSPRNERLLNIHNGSVSASIAFWQQLVNLLGSFLKGVTDLMRGK